MRVAREAFTQPGSGWCSTPYGRIGTAVALFSVVKRQHEGFALGFVTTRMFEAAVIVLPDVPVWTRSASHSGDGAHRSSAAHLVHARNEARRQREGVRGWEVVGTAPIFFWELSLRLWMTFKGFNPFAPILAPPSAEWGSPATS